MCDDTMLIWNDVHDLYVAAYADLICFYAFWCLYDVCLIFLFMWDLYLDLFFLNIYINDIGNNVAGACV